MTDSIYDLRQHEFGKRRDRLRAGDEVVVDRGTVCILVRVGRVIEDKGPGGKFIWERDVNELARKRGERR